MRLSLRPSGTSPRTMRCARPSTMAVLPTPGSPISTGLFLVRRDSTWITRRTSSSRPITGSSLPLRASSVRSRPYFSSASYLPSGFWSVTRWLPRTDGQRLEHLLARDAVGLQLIDGGRLAGLVQQAEQQVLGADVLVLHRLGFGLRGVEHDAQARGEVRLRTAVRLGLLGQVGAQRAGDGRGIDVQLAQHARDDAVRLFGERDQQVLGLHLGVVQLRRQLRRREHGLLGLLGELVEIHDRLLSFLLLRFSLPQLARSDSYNARSSSLSVFGMSTSTFA